MLCPVDLTARGEDVTKLTLRTFQFNSTKVHTHINRVNRVIHRHGGRPLCLLQ